ncbi:MAG: hypothetical protein SPL42_01960 [Bacteroidales bacterium]|nr:hypothetical protein [Bacteroidales bacterium]MDY6347186.1 hypothetical protein [Bacteroidales bacterium]
MERSTILRRIMILTGIILFLCFSACTREPITPLPSGPQPIEYTPEVPEPITNDFTLLKACIGKSLSEAAALLTEHGFVAGDGNKFLKTENGVTKEAEIYSTGNVTLTLKDSDFDILKPGFVQWMNEIRNSVSYTNLVRKSFSLRTGWGNGNQHFDSPEALLNALAPVPLSDGLNADFYGNDFYANRYSLVLMPNLNGVYMQLINHLAGQPSDDFTESDLQQSDIQKHILISKVDYLTFRYKGFYARNVTYKLNSGNEIPFVSQYQSPGDFGYIKLFYRNTDNLLMDGSIVWNGCGKLNFPDNFRAGLPMDNGLPYPGQDRIAFINDGGHYETVTDENELKHIWQSVSQQKEFQHYYGNSSKKVAVYLYTPSVGVGNPADAYYLVFTEQ